jgi:hypothetical protein
MKNRNRETSQASASYTLEANAAPIRTNVVPLRPMDEKKAGSMSLDSRNSVSSQKMLLTHERIAERAKALWLASGRVPGRDEQNWHEAEAQLRAELKSD